MFFLTHDMYDISHALLQKIVWNALECKKPEIITELVERYPDLKIPQSSLMHIAIITHSSLKFDIMGLVYRHQPHIQVKDSQGKTPLHLAVSGSDRLGVKFLCDRGADIYAEDAEGMTPLDIVVRDKHFHLLVTLLKYRNQFKTQDVHRLFRLAIESENIVIVSEFIKHYSLALNEQDETGKTLLHHAIEGGKAYIVISLIHAGAHLQVKDNQGETPLHLAIKKKLILEVFFEYKYIVNKLNDFSYIQLALETDDYALFAELSSFLPSYSPEEVAKLIKTAIHRRNYLTLKLILYSYIPAEDRESILKQSFRNLSF